MYYALVTTLSLLISLWVSLYCQSLLVADSAKRGPQISFDLGFYIAMQTMSSPLFYEGG